MISQTLTAKGWRHDQEGGGEYIFSVNFGMVEKTRTGSLPMKTYNFSTGGWDTTQQAYTQVYYTRFVKIAAHSSDSVIWTADCLSSGQWGNFLFIAEIMVPYAMEHFPEEGRWERVALVEF